MTATSYMAQTIAQRRRAKAELESKLSPALRLALSGVPTAQRETAAKAAVLLEMGYKDMEVATSLGITWRTLEGLRVQMRTGIVEGYRMHGYSDREIQVTLFRGVESASSVVDTLRVRDDDQTAP